MVKPFLSIIIPAYNESERLPLTLIDIDKNLSEQEYSYEIIVINDGSTDNTAEIVERFTPIIKNLKMLDNKENHGKGGAVQQGMLIAKGSWRLFMDADNSTSIAEFNKILPYLKEGYDIVMGSRGVRGAVINPPSPLRRYLAGKLGNLFIQMMLLRGTKDSQCGFKCFSEESAERIFPILRTKQWAFDVEVLVLAKKMGYRVKEMPVNWADSPASKVRFSSYFKTLWEVIKIWWWIKRDAYKLNG
ncbi:MAG: dolichyl-phosphate beta-glucosyltransferase [Patescibacteria group bacterium]